MEAAPAITPSVDYTPRQGAVCPGCGRSRATTVRSDSWIKGQTIWYRQRWHICPACGLRFASLQESA